MTKVLEDLQVQLVGAGVGQSGFGVQWACTWCRGVVGNTIINWERSTENWLWSRSCFTKDIVGATAEGMVGSIWWIQSQVVFIADIGSDI
jgi:hypothetical protein